MDYRDRGKIDRCCNNVSSRINMRALWPHLIKNRIFLIGDVNIPVWERSLEREDTIRDIWTTIKTRGPYAFANLLRSLRATNHNEVADILEDKAPLFSREIVERNDSTTNGNGPSNSETEVDWYSNTKLLTSHEPLVINVKRAERFMDEPDAMAIRKYRMRRKPHGYVLIITIIDYIAQPIRIAAEHDRANLKQLFEDMGFEVTVPDPETVLTGAKIKEIVREFSKRDFHKVDSCFVIISAHGDEVEHNSSFESAIHGTDYNLPGAEKVLCRDLVDMFNADRCKDLIEKPKVFIFQACREKASEHRDRSAADGFNRKSDPRHHSDILIAHSTMPGYRSYRDEYNGSWYIQVLCEVFMRHACTMHLDDLFKKVDERLSLLRTYDGKAQTSTVKMMGFNQHLYLNPGIFEDS